MLLIHLFFYASFYCISGSLQHVCTTHCDCIKTRHDRKRPLLWDHAGRTKDRWVSNIFPGALISVRFFPTHSVDYGKSKKKTLRELIFTIGHFFLVLREEIFADCDNLSL